MSKLTLVTVGIPTYNEEKNIEKLIKSLLAQDTQGKFIYNILINLDCPSDGTRDIVNNLSKIYDNVSFIDNNDRKGKPCRINQIFERSESAAVVILDADVVIESNYFLSLLLEPVLSKRKVDLVSGLALPTEPKTMAAKAAYGLFKVWYEAKKSSSSPMYSCEGSVRAFSRNLYLNLRFPVGVSADDVFPYLFCQKNGYSFAYEPRALVRFYSPTTWKDYFSQSARYLKSRQIQEMSFDKEILDENYDIRLGGRIIGLLKSMVLAPWCTILYLVTYPIIIYKSIVGKKNKTSLWTVVESSKQVYRPKLVISSYDSIENKFYRGGGAIAIHEMAKRLVDVFEVVVVCGRSDLNEVDQTIDGVLYKKVGMPFFWFIPMSQLLFTASLYFWSIYMKYDVWVESFTPPFSVSMLPLIAGKKHIGLVHMLSGKEMNRKYRLPFETVEALGLKIYKNIIVLSDLWKEAILGINPRCNVHVIPNGINLPSDSKVVKKNQFLYLGRIEIVQKGLDLLLKAMTEINSDIKLIIAGAGPKSEESGLRNLVYKYNLKERVELVGYVDGEAKRKLLTESQFLVVPSRYETFSLVALEAMSYGLPLVTFDIGGLSWVESGCRLVARPGDSKSLAEGIVKLANGKSLRQKMSLSCIKKVKKYSWEKVAESYKQVIYAVYENNK